MQHLLAVATDQSPSLICPPSVPSSSPPPLDHQCASSIVDTAVQSPILSNNSVIISTSIGRNGDMISPITKRWSMAADTSMISTSSPQLRLKLETMENDLTRLQLKNYEISNKYQSMLRDYDSMMRSANETQRQLDSCIHEKQLMHEQVSTIGCYLYK